MFKELIKFIPTLDQAALKKMEMQLSGRFARVAKGFGRGLGKALKFAAVGGGPLGLLLVALNRLINPLQEIEQSMENILEKSADVVTNAKQFGTDAGKLLRLQALAESKGIGQSDLFNLISKFQVALAEAENDPNKDTSVRQFVGSTDIADAFFEFIQALQKLEPNQRALVQQEVFGEKQIGKMSSFLDTDFGSALSALGPISAKQLTDSAVKLNQFDDLKKAAEARNSLSNFVKGSKEIDENMIRAMIKNQQDEKQREIDRIKGYENLATISNGFAQMLSLVETGVQKLIDVSKTLVEMSGVLKKIPGLKTLRGWFGGGN